MTRPRAGTPHESCGPARWLALARRSSCGAPRSMEAFGRLHDLLDELEHFDPAVAPEAQAADELFGRLVKLSPSAQVARVTDDLRHQQWGGSPRRFSDRLGSYGVPILRPPTTGPRWAPHAPTPCGARPGGRPRRRGGRGRGWSRRRRGRAPGRPLRRRAGRGGSRRRGPRSARA